MIFQLKNLFGRYIEERVKVQGFVGLLNLDSLLKCDPKTLGNEIKICADMLENRTNDLRFEPWREGKAGCRLKETIKIHRGTGEEVGMDEKDPNEYHLYLIIMLIDMISSLLKHI